MLYTYILIMAISIFIGFVSGILPLVITIPLGNFIAKKLNSKTKKIIEQLKDNVQNSNATEIQNISYTPPVDLTKKTNINEKTNITNELINYRKYYRPKIYITTLNELHFYEVLLDIAKELDLILFCQVSLYSIIEPKKELDRSTKRTFLNKIDRKSIDFVLVDKKNCKIKLCIELDDSTHNKKDRIVRDEFINTLFEQLGISLLRYPVYPVYYRETLKNRILQRIQDPTSINSSKTRM